MTDAASGPATDPVSGPVTGPATDTVAPWLREILRCPACRHELADTGDAVAPTLTCTNAECALVYRVDGGIPVLLVDEATGPA